MKYLTAFTFSILVFSCSFQSFGVEESDSSYPKLQFRLESGHTSSDEAWAKTYAMLKAVPKLCDEIWFGTGFGMPMLEKHRENAERILKASCDVRKFGWKPALQIQATLGHGGPFTVGQDYSGRDWTGWTGSTGYEDKFCNCPRDPRFLEYMRQMALIYADLKPSSVWIDDDLRIDNHGDASKNSLDGCWCGRCIADFNAKTGGKWTRETLQRAAKKDARKRIAYEEFAIESVADVARVIAKVFKEVSPETTLALQHAYWATRTNLAIIKALSEESEKTVGFRPGGGAYFDSNPHNQIRKTLEVARFRRNFAKPELVQFWTHEIACFPRTYNVRAAESIVIEAFSAIMNGMDSASALVVNYGKESEDLYLRSRLRAMEQAYPVLSAFARSCEGATIVGYSSNADCGKLYTFAHMGIPVLFGIGKSCGTLTRKDINHTYTFMTSSDVQNVRDELDRRAKGNIAVLKSPFVGMMIPRVSKKDGSFRNVALLNLRIGVQGPVRIAIRNVPKEVKNLVWRELRCEPKILPVLHDKEFSYVEIPSLGPWNGGFLE
jgi:hypothetical protein